MSDNIETAKTFWAESGKYPSYGTIKQRRLHEVNYLVPQLRNIKTLIDLGCGDGALISCLRRLTDIEKYYAYDYSDALLKWVDDALDTEIEVKQYDCYNPAELPQADAVVFAGVLPFLFEDAEALEMLSAIAEAAPVLYLRAPCTLLPEDEVVNNFSEKLKAQYSANYRTVGHVLDLLSNYFTVEAVDRAYPDEIESEFGTKQFYFKAVRK